MSEQGVVLDVKRRQFLLKSASCLGVAGFGLALFPFLNAWLPTAKVQALGAPVKVDLTNLQSGELKIIEWRGKPIWIIRRNQQMLAQLGKHDSKLRDPESRVNQQPQYAQNPYRSREPEVLVLEGICTHLGCSPKYKPNLKELGPDWPGGFFCPCHGSSFDISGRVFKGVPAPINMAVPPHQFVDANTLIIGIDENNPEGV